MRRAQTRVMLLAAGTLLVSALQAPHLLAVWRLGSGGLQLIRAHASLLRGSGEPACRPRWEEDAGGERRSIALAAAERDLDRALAAEPANPRVRLRRAFVHLVRSEPRPATGLLPPAPDADPFVSYYAGMAAHLDGRQDEAIAIWRGLPEFDLHAADLGSLAFADGCLASAQAYWSIADRIRPEPDPRKVSMYLDNCQLLTSLSRFADAAASCHKALVADPNPWTFVVAGQRLLALDRSDEVIAASEDRLRRQGLSAAQAQEVRRLIAQAWVRKGDDARALDEFRRIDAPDNKWIAFEMAELNMRIRRYDEAGRLFTRVLQLDTTGTLAARARQYLAVIARETRER